MKFNFLQLVLCLSLFSSSLYAKNNLTMSVISRNIEAYNNFLQEKQQTVLKVDSLVSQHANRNIASMVIIMQALDKGGYQAELNMIEAPNYGRELILVKEGKVMIMHQDAWGISADANVYKSSVIIPKGGIVKGIYVAEPNIKKYNISSATDLQPYTATSTPAWIVGWKTLEKLNLKALYKTAKKEHMFSLVLYRNVDFTIQEFANTSDLAYTFQGKRLIPVPGIKLVLDGSRHFLVSKKHKNGKKVYQALEKGLKILREKGTVQRYLTESGFYRKELESWKPIYVD